MKIKHHEEIIDLKTTVPVIPLRDIVVFPHMIYPLLIGRNFTINALNEAMAKNKQVFLVSQKSASVDSPKPDDLYKTGVIARILQVMKMPNGTLKVLVEGLIRAEIKKITKTKSFFLANTEVISSEMNETDRETEALCRSVSEQFTEYVRFHRRVPDEVIVNLATINEYRHRADTISAHTLQKIETKQQVLESKNVKEQFIILSEILKEEIEILKIEQKIDGTVKESMSRSQREFYLQQQLKAIKDELGQFEEPAAEVDDLYSKLESYNCPPEVKAKAEQARLILESVSSDGSWGIHNFKYTEAMLVRARDIISE